MKMRAELADINHCAVPFLSRAVVNLSWYDDIKYSSTLSLRLFKHDISEFFKLIVRIIILLVKMQPIFQSVIVLFFFRSPFSKCQSFSRYKISQLR